MSQMVSFYRLPVLQKLFSFCEQTTDVCEELGVVALQLLRTRIGSMLLSTSFMQTAIREEALVARLAAPVARLEQQVVQTAQADKAPVPPNTVQIKFVQTGHDKALPIKPGTEQMNELKFAYCPHAEALANWEDLRHHQQRHEQHEITHLQPPAKTAAPGLV